MLKIEYVATDDLIPYINNSRTHSESQIKQIASSIREFGFTNPILIDDQGTIIAGHGRVMAAKVLQLDKVPTITLGALSDAQRKAYVIADNKLALNAGWDTEVLFAEIEALQDLNFDTKLLGFSPDELAEMLDLDNNKNDSENPYTDKIDSPVYEPSGEKPKIDELYDNAKAMDLIKSIRESNLDEKEKQFLISAASRHIVFDYGKIANFYAHSSKECQELMENSALVIIDFDNAIANGFVKLNQDIDSMVEFDE